MTKHGDIWLLVNGRRALFLDPMVDVNYREDERHRLMLLAAKSGVNAGEWMYTNVHDALGTYTPNRTMSGFDLELLVCRISARGWHEYIVRWDIAKPGHLRRSMENAEFRVKIKDECR